jgi:hypothetical protein
MPILRLRISLRSRIILVQRDVILVHRRPELGVGASLVCGRETLRLLASTLIGSLVVVGRRLVQSIVADCLAN